MAHECEHPERIDRLEQTVDALKEEIHKGDLEFLKLNEAVDRLSDTLKELVPQVNKVIDNTQALKWAVLGGVGVMVAKDLGLVGALVELLF